MEVTLGNRIQELLKQKRMTQKELAERAEVTEAAMSHYIKGDRSPRAIVLAKIADALGTTSEYLLGGNPNQKEEDLVYAKRLIARNASQMTLEEKKAFLELLIGGN